MKTILVRFRRLAAPAILLAMALALAAIPAHSLDVLSGPLVGPTTHAASTSSLVEDDEVSVGSVVVSINDGLFHVGDRRTIYATAIVSFGDIDANQQGYFDAILTIDGKEWVMAVEQVNGSSDEDGRTEFNMSAEVEGCEVGTASIQVTATVTGWENGFWSDDLILNQKGSASATATVQYPLLGPILNPGSQSFNHPGTANHADLLYNYSAEDVFVSDAWVNKAKMLLTSVPPGNDPLGTPTLGALVAGDVKHEAGPHPGTTVQVPFTWGITTAKIFVLGGPWVRTFSPNTTEDSCTDPGSGGTGTVPPSESSDESRRSSSGERHVKQQLIGRWPTIPDPVGVLLRLVDPVSGDTYEFLLDPAGDFSWSEITLGPTVDVELNPGGVRPPYEQTLVPGVPLSRLESPDGVPDAFTLFERAVGPISGWFGASDGGPIEVELLIRPTPSGPLERKGTVSGGPFELRSLGWFDLEGPGSELVLVGHPDGGRSLASPETLAVPLSASAEPVDIGDHTWAVLPRSPRPMIGFRGRILDRDTAMPIGGVAIRTESDPGGLIDGETATGPDGRFSLAVPNGPHIVRGSAGDLGYEVIAPKAIDFGASGYDFYDVGDRYLRRLPLSAAPEGRGAASRMQITPNPSTAGATIRFLMPAPGEASITIHDLWGRLVATRESAFRAGPAMVEWDGIDREGRPAAPGIYFVRAAGMGLHETAKLILLGQ